MNRASDGRRKLELGHEIPQELCTRRGAESFPGDADTIWLSQTRVGINAYKEWSTLSSSLEENVMCLGPPLQPFRSRITTVGCILSDQDPCFQ
jgi:hypothetical protein